MSTTRRKLTTIFSADVQGYSRLMAADEEGTLATLKKYRDAMARLIEAHSGRVVNTWGDGLIAEFPSVVESVRAAIDVQNELAEYNAGRAADERMLFRIGINLGDVIVEGDDIYGDGVNIAARLQTSAEPGGIVISNTVYDQVRNKMTVGFEFLGQLPVKNIAEAVPSYAVKIGETPAAEPEPKEPRTEWGRQPVQSAPPARGPVASSPAGSPVISRKMAIIGFVAAIPVVVNLLSWEGEFWARWPLFGFAMLAGLIWARTNRLIDPILATLGVAGLGVIAVNLLSWSGVFWAAWPALVISVAAGLRWITGPGRRRSAR
ncbi:adenylate/guanylate cyclase domain-containing protein [Allomesorhizobium camelthorni]|uniref:Adenylate/guanylate cyclase domain-containing protein n=1 Tax=Allomesorhizobium camelthorni TaxID=475069 RepID=A0A6G4W9M5_9HYPH|nr:adenylate/guanylate cyclase domain-containing protein [Mesorhizobium camelthorni]NGO50923.1 adenylate/guanylate cyclase domain-containing protein [Mesorhizobium camelthorni]